MTEIEAIRRRRSIRKYEDRALSAEDALALRREIDRLNALGGLHMQLVADERQAFRTFLAYGKFEGVSDYIMVIGPKSDSLNYDAGYYGEQLVLFAERMGLGTCWVGLTYKKVKGAFEVSEGEQILCCIAVGYPAEEGRVHKSKRPDRVSNIGEDTPGWFAAGVEAALLAPTAVNQQKFRFTYFPPAAEGEKARVKPQKEFSIVGYTKIDLGIAMCHFEIGAGPENFTWLDSPL